MLSIHSKKIVSGGGGVNEGDGFQAYTASNLSRRH